MRRVCMQILLLSLLCSQAMAQIQEYRSDDGTTVYTNTESQDLAKQYQTRAGTIRIHQAPNSKQHQVVLSSRAGQDRYTAPMTFVTPSKSFRNVPLELSFQAYFSGQPLPSRWVKVSSQRQVNLSQELMEVGQKYNVDPWLLDSVIRFESNYRMPARSHVGAIGLMQLMPETARTMGVDPYSFSGNLHGGAQYLAKQLVRFKRLDYALAAYNAGPNAVKKYGGVPPYAETQSYVYKITSHYYRMKNRD